jgi:hypothetical protein
VRVRQLQPEGLSVRHPIPMVSASANPSPMVCASATPQPDALRVH